MHARMAYTPPRRGGSNLFHSFRLLLARQVLLRNASAAQEVCFLRIRMRTPLVDTAAGEERSSVRRCRGRFPGLGAHGLLGLL